MRRLGQANHAGMEYADERCEAYLRVLDEHMARLQLQADSIH